MEDDVTVTDAQFSECEYTDLCGSDFFDFFF